MDLDSNWSGGLKPTSSQVALFTSATFSPNGLQPQSASVSFAGISLASGAGSLTFTGPGNGTAKTLSIGASGVVNSSASALTFDISSKVNIVLVADASFTASNGAIAINDDKSTAIKFDLNDHALTLNGSNTASFIAQDFGDNSTLARGSLVKSGTGTWTLSGNNVYAGTTTISQGTLSAGKIVVASGSSNLGNAASAVILGDATNTGILSYTGTTATYTRGFTVNAGGGEVDTVTSGQTLTIGTGNVATSGLFTVSGAGATSITSVVSGTGGLAKAGSGTLTLTNTNTFTGGVTLISGTLTVNNGATLAAASSPLTVNSGTLNLNNAAQTVASLGGIGGTINLATNHILTVNQATTTSFAGSLAGSNANLVKSGIGSLKLTGGNSYSGTTTVTAGTLLLGQTTALYSGTDTNWTAAKIIVESGATLALNVGGSGEFTTGNLDTLKALGTGSGGFKTGSFLGFDTTNASGGIFTYNSNIVNPNAGANALGVVKLGPGTLVLGGSNTYSGDTKVTAGTLKLGAASALSPNTKLTVAPGASFDANGFSQTLSDLSGSGDLSVGTGGLVVQPSGTSTFSGALTGNGGFTMSGTGTLILSGTNSFSGTTTIQSGTVKLGAPGALPTGAIVELSSGATLDLNGNAATLGKLAGDGSVTLGGATLTVSQDVPATFTGAFSGAGGLAKAGTGILTVTGSSPLFTGATTISGGQLKLNGSIANSAVTLSGGTLSGNGTVGALTISSGGVLAPGNSPGTMSSGTTSFEGGGSFQVEINQATGGSAGGATGWDLLSISGGLAVNATSGNKFTINLVSLGLNNIAGPADSFTSSQNYTFTIANTNTGITNFSADAFNLNTTLFQNSINGSWSIAQSGNALNLVYNASAIPEPSTYAAFAGIAALALGAWRRRKLGN